MDFVSPKTVELKTSSPKLLLLLLLTICFTLATVLQQLAVTWSASRGHEDNLLAIVLGDARRMFASQFLTEADVYFHSGYYPSVFDEAQAQRKNHLAASASLPEHDHEAPGHDHEHCNADEISFLDKRPNDWIEKFGRNFFVAEHTELSGGDTRELLPWLRLSAELDPTNPLTYTMGAYLLRQHIHKPQEALEFLREGLRANTNSFEILYELGRLFDEDFHDTRRAENLWEKALEKWEATEGRSPEPDVTTYREALTHLATSKEKSGRIAEAISYLSRVKKLSPDPAAIQKRIDELQQKSAVPSNAPGQNR